MFHPPCGPIASWADGDVLRATGIRYAVADRFAAPRPAPDHDEVFAATSWSPVCPQVRSEFLEQAFGGGIGDRTRDEHCQYLSIIMPPDAGPGDDLPVMVWLHGGSYLYFGGDVAIMDGAPLVREQRVIVVSVTYRLGLFGYLGDGDSPGRPGNLGLLDQLEALRWVQRNIAAFGGDPRNVTAFGQSAGGDAVAHLMATPGAAGMFRRAIIQSAPLGIALGREAMYAAMAQAAREVTVDTPTEAVLELQTRAAAAAAPYRLLAAMPFGTQYGVEPLPAEDEVAAAWAAVAPEIDVLIGYTSEEARLFVPRMPALQRLRRLPILGGLACRLIAAAVTRKAYGQAAASFAARHARAGGRAWRYVITWSAPGNEYGAAHAIDLPLLFGDESAWESAEILEGATWAGLTADARQVRRLWADFARDGGLPDRGEIPGTLTYERVRAV